MVWTQFLSAAGICRSAFPFYFHCCRGLPVPEKRFLIYGILYTLKQYVMKNREKKKEKKENKGMKVKSDYQNDKLAAREPIVKTKTKK